MGVFRKLDDLLLVSPVCHYSCPYHSTSFSFPYKVQVDPFVLWFIFFYFLDVCFVCLVFDVLGFVDAI